MTESTIYLASRTEQENQMLMKKLEPLSRPDESVRFAGVHLQGLVFAARENITAVVVNVAEWTKQEQGLISDVRRAGYLGPIVVLARAKAGPLLRELRAMSAVVHIEKPFEVKDVLGVLGKIMKSKVLWQQMHRRFATDEWGELSFPSLSLTARVCNLSRGGAHLQLPAPAAVNVGDFVNLKLDLQTVKKVHIVPARIVWIADSEANHESVHIGIEFVSFAESRRRNRGQPSEHHFRSDRGVQPHSGVSRRVLA